MINSSNPWLLTISFWVIEKTTEPPLGVNFIPFEIMLIRICCSFVLSPIKELEIFPFILEIKFTFFCFAWASQIMLIFSIKVEKSIVLFAKTVRPLSIRLISKISFIRFSKNFAELETFEILSITNSVLWTDCWANSDIPIIAFIGVRISWLILDKNSVLALFACSAAIKAVFSISFWRISSS